MLIRRCAWHREFHGYTLIHGVAAWRGFSLKFTDGVCRSCAERVRIEWRLARLPTDALPPPAVSLLSPRLGHAGVAVGLVVLVATALPVKLISDALLRGARTDPQVVVGEEVPSHAAVSTSLESAPPRVSRHRPPITVPPLRRRATGPEGPEGARVAAVVTPPVRLVPSSAAMGAEGVPPPETVVVAPRPVQATSPAPSVSRLRGTEDEFAGRVRRASTVRLLLSPPPERPRHAGVAVQAP
jgi:hypothetical protein